MTSEETGVAQACAGAATRAVFGALADGTPIEIVTLVNARGTTARVMTLGATLQSLEVAGRDGTRADIVLGYDTAKEYVGNAHYFGATVGRYANRIAGGKFSLDGRCYALEVNDAPNALHGGCNGLDKQVWQIVSCGDDPVANVVMRHVSADGEGGYPGELTVTAIYSLADDDTLTIAYRATTTAPTIVNITNHSFFNLAGKGDILDHRLTLHAAAYTPVDDMLIPTGERRSVAETPFDFRASAAVGSRIRDARDEQLRIGRGYDHNYVVDGAPGGLRPAARVEHVASGRVMELLVTSPGLQFYSGNFLDGAVFGKRGRSYRQSDGLCLEPQLFPDAPNQPGFLDARLDPGETYRSTMVLRFSTTAE